MKPLSRAMSRRATFQPSIQRRGTRTPRSRSAHLVAIGFGLRRSHPLPTSAEFADVDASKPSGARTTAAGTIDLVHILFGILSGLRSRHTLVPLAKTAEIADHTRLA